MKFFFDNNLSPYLAKALNALCAHEGVAVEHLRQMFPEDILDAEWIERLAKEGEWSVITQDRLMRNRLQKRSISSVRADCVRFDQGLGQPPILGESRTTGQVVAENHGTGRTRRRRGGVRSAVAIQRQRKIQGTQTLTKEDVFSSIDLESGRSTSSLKSLSPRWRMMMR